MTAAPVIRRDVTVILTRGVKTQIDLDDEQARKREKCMFDFRDKVLN